ncbi:hypothetical protein KKF84_03340 [Myxococcota bacterium]|nr:hypothetical protein [Myxococcota bacterium]
MAIIIGNENEARLLLRLMVYSKFQLHPGRIVRKSGLGEIWHSQKLPDEKFTAAVMFACGQGWVEERQGWVKLTPQGYYEA